MMDAGAFSDKDVVEASEALVRLLADAGRHGEIFGRYGVRAMPTVLFLDPDGKVVGQLRARDPKSVAAQFREVAEKHSRSPKFLRDYGKALDQAKTDGKPLAVFFHDDKSRSLDYEKALDDESLKDLFERIVFVKVEVRKGDETVKAYNVTSPPILYVVDPAAEKPQASPYRKIYGQKTARDFKRDLEEALRKAEKK